MNRPLEIAGFLSQNGWDDAQATPLQADFSSRHFARLERGNAQRAILMDAEADQNTASFVAIAKLLRSLDLSAPEIYAANPPQGLVLMEDFGDRNIGRIIDAGADAAPLYRRAVDVLVHLHKRFDPSVARGFDLPVFNTVLFTAQTELFLEFWIPFTTGREATPEQTESFRTAWKQTLRSIEILPQTLMLRDFMPDNLMSLEGRADWRALGLLDFQDAGIGPLPYDLASLCEVVRRDCGLLDDMIDYYHEQAASPLTKPELRSACRVLSAQRHMRILGIIARMALRTGRREKLDYAPRIWAHLDQLLRDNALRPIWAWMDEFGPFR